MIDFGKLPLLQDEYPLDYVGRHQATSPQAAAWIKKTREELQTDSVQQALLAALKKFRPEDANHKVSKKLYNKSFKEAKSLEDAIDAATEEQQQVHADLTAAQANKVKQSELIENLEKRNTHLTETLKNLNSALASVKKKQECHFPLFTILHTTSSSGKECLTLKTPFFLGYPGRFGVVCLGFPLVYKDARDSGKNKIMGKSGKPIKEATIYFDQPVAIKIVWKGSDPSEEIRQTIEKWKKYDKSGEKFSYYSTQVRQSLFKLKVLADIDSEELQLLKELVSKASELPPELTAKIRNITDAADGKSVTFGVVEIEKLQELLYKAVSNTPILQSKPELKGNTEVKKAHLEKMLLQKLQKFFRYDNTQPSKQSPTFYKGYMILPLRKGISLGELWDGVLQSRSAGEVALEGMTFQKAIELCIAVIEAVIAFHATSKVHRDLKLDNVMVFHNPEGKFEIELVDPDMAVPVDVPTENLLQGTLGFMATEIFALRAKSLNPHKNPQYVPAFIHDIYSLGVMLTIVLTGSTYLIDARIEHYKIESNMLKAPPKLKTQLLQDTLKDEPNANAYWLQRYPGCNSKLKPICSILLDMLVEPDFLTYGMPGIKQEPLVRPSLDQVLVVFNQALLGFDDSVETKSLLSAIERENEEIDLAKKALFFEKVQFSVVLLDKVAAFHKTECVYQNIAPINITYKKNEPGGGVPFEVFLNEDKKAKINEIQLEVRHTLHYLDPGIIQQLQRTGFEYYNALVTYDIFCLGLTLLLLWTENDVATADRAQELGTHASLGVIERSWSEATAFLKKIRSLAPLNLTWLHDTPQASAFWAWRYPTNNNDTWRIREVILKMLRAPSIQQMQRNSGMLASSSSMQRDVSTMSLSSSHAQADNISVTSASRVSLASASPKSPLLEPWISLADAIKAFENLLPGSRIIPSTDKRFTPPSLTIESTSAVAFTIREKA